MSYELDRVILELFEKGFIPFDVAHEINGYFLSEEVSAGVFEEKVRRMLGQTISRMSAEEVLLASSFERILTNIFYDRIYFKLSQLKSSGKKEWLENTVEILEELHQPKSFTISAVADPKILEVLMPYMVCEINKDFDRIFRQSGQKIRVIVKSLFMDPKAGTLELRNLGDVKVLADWAEFVKSSSGDIVLVGHTYASRDGERAQKLALELVSAGAKIFTDLKLPNLFDSQSWEKLGEAVGKSPAKNGETVIYLNGGMFIAKPFDLEKIRAVWAIVHQDCIRIRCMFSRDCSPEKLFPQFAAKPAE